MFSDKIELDPRYHRNMVYFIISFFADVDTFKYFNNKYKIVGLPVAHFPQKILPSVALIAETCARCSN